MAGVKVQTPRQLARRARLKYVSDHDPGMTRVRHGSGFVYRWQSGRNAVSKADRLRVTSLAIPPAWTDVWVCGDAEGHLQATGRDDRGRKQYLYHERWQETVNLAKFDRLQAMGEILPSLRAQVLQDLKQRTLNRRAVAALVVRLLDVTGIRIGNNEYLRDNESYGLTTLQDRQISIQGSAIDFRFQGKSGIHQEIKLTDAPLARRIRRCRALAGSFVFQFREDHSQRPITSTDVNEYLADVSKGVLTAKDFRTWRASTFVASRLARENPPETGRGAKRTANAILRQAAADLGNTLTVCRKYYVHAGLVSTFLDGKLAVCCKRFRPRSPSSLSCDEQLLMHVLKRI